MNHQLIETRRTKMSKTRRNFCWNPSNIYGKKNAVAMLSIYKKLAPELRDRNSLNDGTKSVAMTQ